MPHTRRCLVTRSLLSVAALFAALLVSSCASGPPEILGVEWTLESRPSQGPGDGREDLSVFARVSDSEGMDDIEAMWVINDAAELSWSLDPSSWTRHSLGPDNWLGAGGLSMPDGSRPPPGRYRVVVADLAGNRANYEFSIGKIEKPRELPAPFWKDGRVGLAKAWPENYLLAYDAVGSLLRSALVPAMGGSLASIVGTMDAARIQAFAIYGYDPSTRMGGYSKRIPIR